MIIFVMIMLSLVFILNAATLEETIQNLSGDAAKSYVNPIVTGFGTNMNGGWYHKSPKAKFFKWDLEFGVVMMGTPFKSADEKFDVNGSFNFNREQAEELLGATAMPAAQREALLQQIMSQNFTVGIYGPTIIGPEYDELDPENTAINIAFEEHEISYTYADQSYTQTVGANNIMLPVGGLMEDIPILPLVVPQLSIGTFVGTQLSFRYLPNMETMEELGDVSYFGFGIQHNPAYWSPIPIPVDVSLSFFTQSLKLGSIVEANASTYGLNVSKTFGMKLASVTPYAGLALETSNMIFKYDYILDYSDLGAPIESQIKFDIDGKNSSRLTAGLSFRLALLNINFDYNISEYPSYTLGTMLNFSW